MKYLHKAMLRTILLLLLGVGLAVSSGGGAANTMGGSATKAAIEDGGDRNGSGRRRELAERSSMDLEVDTFNNHGLLLGKDRELFHASIDLRKAWSKLMDKESWVSLFRSIVKALSHVSGAEDNQLVFKEIAIDMLCDIRRSNPEASVKLFQGTIKQAENYARRQGRFIVIYIEDASGGTVGNRESRSAKASEQFRRAFSDSYLGALLNDEFVFFAGSTAHSPTHNIAKLLGYSKKDLPLFAILTPAYVEVPSMEKKRLLPEVVVTLRMSSSDIDSNKITRFLQRVLEVHGPIIRAKKREFDEILISAEALASIVPRGTLQDVNTAGEVQQPVSAAETRRRATLLRQLPSEPAYDSAGGTINVTLRMRNGSIATRRFRLLDPALSIPRWADASGVLSPGTVLTTKIQQTIVVLSEETMGKKTVKDAGLTHCVITVQPK